MIAPSIDKRPRRKDNGCPFDPALPLDYHRACAKRQTWPSMEAVADALSVPRGNEHTPP